MVVMRSKVRFRVGRDVDSISPRRIEAENKSGSTPAQAGRHRSLSCNKKALIARVEAGEA